MRKKMKGPKVAASTPRQHDILRLAKQHGRVEVDGLATHFDVTPQTIRRDLNELCEGGQLHRVHGGAVFPTGAANYAYEQRRQISSDGKQRIGARAAALIPDRSSVILNIGTTTEQVANALLRHEEILVVTNNINVANILRESPNAEVIIAGGRVRSSDGGVIGEATMDFMRQFRVDFAVIGASAIDLDGTVLDYDYREVRVAQEIMRHARKTILVADRMKFERRAPIRIGSLSDVDVFVTDEPPPPSVVALCRDSGVQVEVAADMPVAAETEAPRVA